MYIPITFPETSFNAHHTQHWQMLIKTAGGIVNWYNLSRGKCGHQYQNALQSVLLLTVPIPLPGMYSK